VHARESTLAVFDHATGEVLTRRVVGRPHELLAVLREIARPTRMVYEAGPTGYGLARRGRAEGLEVAVCAPGKTDRPASDRVKTDKRDAIRLARLLAAGELVLVTVPSVEREQLRDLVRCREDIRADLMRARHRIGKFLLRREIYYEGPAVPWTLKYRSWLTSVRFADPASRATLADYLHAHDVLIARRDQVEAELAKLALTAPCAPTIARLRCLRGIDTLTAFGLCAEIGEWERFDHPDQLASYLGIVPCEHTTGAQRRLGSITKAGSTHARRLLVEASWHYRRGPAVGQALEHRQRGHAPEIINISWKAQRLAQRPLAPAQRLAPQARRDRCGRRRARARRLLLGDRHLARSSRPGAAGIPAGGRPPHAGSPAPTEAEDNHPSEDHQLTLTPPIDTPSVRLARRPEAARLARSNSAIRRLSNRAPTRGGTAALDNRQRTCAEQRSWASPRI
jgi:transposase